MLHRFRIALASALALIVLIFSGSTALAQEPPPVGEASHHSYDSRSGYRQAKVRTPQRSVVVGNIPNKGFTDRSVLNRWNNIAGWRLFRYCGAGCNMRKHVVFRKCNNDGPFKCNHDRAAWVQNIRDPQTGWYVRSIIHYKPWQIGANEFLDADALAHELGHTLGLVDHVFWFPDFPNGWRQCNRPDKRGHSNYDGVMSYCSWRGMDSNGNWRTSEYYLFWGAEDRWMVAAHGYGDRS